MLSVLSTPAPGSTNPSQPGKSGKDDELVVGWVLQVQSRVIDPALWAQALQHPRKGGSALAKRGLLCRL